METFQKKIITIGGIVLIIATIFLLLIVRNTLEKATWPPIKPECPDYWDVSINSLTSTKTCINNSRVNECKNDWPKNDTTPGWCTTGLTENKLITELGGLSKQEDVDCAKNLWAKYEGITWDGITNNNRICENSTFY